MAKPRVALEAADTARPAARETEEVDGMRIPSVATKYQVVRTVGAGLEICAIHVDGAKVESFPLDKFPPKKEHVRQIWGSGRYRFAWRRSDGSACGRSAAFEWDDADFPRRPSYAQPTPPPVPAPATAAPRAAVAATLTPGADGRVAVGEIMQLLAFHDSLAARREEEDARRRQRERDDEDRRLVREREEHDRRMVQRERENAQAMSRQNAAWAATIQSIQAARVPPTDPRVAEALERLAERDDDGDEEPAADPSSAVLQSLAELLLPKIVERFMGGGGASVSAAPAPLPSPSSEPK